jgi:hypothetical protein
MTRQIAQDLGATGDNDGFDLSKMTAREVAAELVRRHQALQVKPLIGASERLAADMPSPPQPTAFPVDPGGISAPNPIDADPAGDGFWHLDRSLHVPSSMPMLAARDAFGAIAKLEAAQHSHQHCPLPLAQEPHAVAQEQTMTDHVALLPADRPIKYDPLDQPVESLLPLSQERNVTGRQRDRVIVTPSNGGTLRPAQIEAKAATGFGAGFAWGMLAGAILMVILLAVEIAVYPSLHVPSRLHQLRAFITSGTSAEDSMLPTNAATTAPSPTTGQASAPAASMGAGIERPTPVLLSMGRDQSKTSIEAKPAIAAVTTSLAAQPASPMPLPNTAPSIQTASGVISAEKAVAPDGSSPTVSAATKPKIKTPVPKVKSASQQQAKSPPARAKAIAALLEAQLSGAKR